MPAKSSCKCCNQLCDAHLLVTCCVCKERYKHSCVEITTNEVRTLNANKGYDWTCVNCRTIGKDLNDLKALIIQLQSDIQELKTENMRMAGSSSVDFEEIISEINERQKRTNNIIIFNIDEPDHSISVREQIEADKVTAVDILNQIVPDLPVASIKPVRLGLFSNTKTRPVKITFQNTDSTHKILMNANKLKTMQCTVTSESPEIAQRDKWNTMEKLGRSCRTDTELVTRIVELNFSTMFRK
nr:unnamed protein product [Callosobruchus chinensis]